MIKTHKQTLKNQNQNAYNLNYDNGNLCGRLRSDKDVKTF